MNSEYHHPIVRQHTNKLQIVAYHMALIADNALQSVLPEMFVMALRTCSRTVHRCLFFDSFASTLECGDQTDYDAPMSVNRP
jgi:hypothetical protein